MAGLRPVAPPSGLGRDGKRLWRRIAVQVAEDGAHMDGRELHWLELACAETDALAEIEAALQGQPRTVKGAQAQMVAHPLIGEARRSRAAVATWLAKLDLVDPDVRAAGSGRGSRTTSAQARAAALSRQYGTGA